MKNTKKTTASVLRKRPAIVMVLGSIVFAAAIFLLLAREKTNLDAEYEAMIANSLSINTQKNAANIDRIIDEAIKAIGTVKHVFAFAEKSDLREYLTRRNGVKPTYIVEYADAQEIREGLLADLAPLDAQEVLKKLKRGETVVTSPYYDESSGDGFFAVIVPLQEEAIGFLYTLLKVDGMMPESFESAVYQNVHSCIIVDNGDIVFNTYEPRRISNFFDDLDAYSLAATDIRRIAEVISSPEADSTTFERHKEAYFVSAALLQHNGWSLVAVVRGPDVLLRSATIFRDVVRTSVIAILITLSAACAIFLQLIFSKKSLERYREELLREKELLRTTLQSIGDGVVTTDSQGLITSLNRVAEELTGWTSSEATGKSFAEVFTLQNEDTGQSMENPIGKVLETGLVIGLANHTELVRRQGEAIPIADSAAPIKAENGQTFGVVMVFRDVSNEKEHNRKIEFLSYHDSLTGLYNRHYLEEMMPRLNGKGCFPVSVIMADVDGLKITNDVFGHRDGDALLKNVADLILRYCKEKGIIARWGGDEFVVLMPGTNLEAAEELAREMKNARVSIDGSNLAFSLSLGCACTDTAEGSITVAMQQAEKNMYQQKLLNGKSYRNAIISTLLATLYEKSSETEEHSKRLEIYCHGIGRKLQLSSKEMNELSLLALLHDIGKVGINPNILQKAGSLTAAEWVEMKRHPEIGYRIAREMPELALVADLILSHHERWDGSGYPQGLQGEAIPLACRILAVVDAFDAMTNDRIYRRAMTIQDALAELERNAGKQFDPRTTELLIEIVTREEMEQE